MTRPRKVLNPGQVAAEPETEVPADKPVAKTTEPVPVAHAREGEPRWQMTEAGWDLI